MATPVYDTAGTYLTNATANTAAIPVPAGVVADDIVIVHLYVEVDDTVTSPAGFTLKYTDEQNDGAGAFRVYTYWKRATGADSGTYDFSWSTSAPRQGGAYTVNSCVTSGDPFQEETLFQLETGNGTTFTPTGLLCQTETLAFLVSGTFSAGSSTPPTGSGGNGSWTERIDQQVNVNTISMASGGGVLSIGHTTSVSATRSQRLYALKGSGSVPYTKPAIVGISTQTVVSAGTSCAVSWPLGVKANCIAVCFLHAKNNIAWNVPSGWADIFTQQNNGTTQRAAAMWIRTTGSESGTVDFTIGSASTLVRSGFMYLIRNAKSTDSPFDGAAVINADSTADDNIEWSDYDPGTASDLVVWHGYYSDDATTPASTLAGTPTANLIYEFETATGTDLTSALYAGLHADSHAAVGARTGATTSTTDGVSVGVVFGVLGKAVELLTGALTLAGPTLTLARAMGMAVGALTMAGVTPTVVSGGSGTTIAVPVGALTIGTGPPTLARTIPSPTGALTVSGTTPTVLQSGGSSPPTGALTLTGQAVATRYLGPSTGALVLSGTTPTVVTGGGATTIPVPAGSATLTGQAPALRWALALPDGTLTLNGQAPTVRQGLLVAAPPGALTLTGTTPQLARRVPIPTGATVLSGQTPTATASGAISPPTGALALTGQGTQLASRVTLPAGALTVTGETPTRTVSSGGLTVPTGALTLTGAYVDVLFGGLFTATLTLEGQPVFLGGAPVIPVPGGSLTLTGHAPSLGLPPVLVIPSGALTLTGQAVATRYLGPGTGPLTLAGQTPTWTVSGGGLTVPVGTLTLDGQYFTIGVPGPATGALILTGYAPILGASPVLGIPQGTVTLTGQTPALATRVALPTGALTLAGTTPTLSGTVLQILPAGTLVLTGQTVAIVGTGAVLPPTATLVLTGQALTTGGTVGVVLPAGTLLLSGTTLTLSRAVVLPAAALLLTGTTPVLSGTARIDPLTGSLVLTGQDLSTGGAGTRLLPAGTLALTGQLPVRLEAMDRSPGAAAVLLTGQSLATRLSVALGPGALVLSGQPLDLVGTGAIVVPSAGLALQGTVVTYTAEGGSPRISPAAGTLTFGASGPLLTLSYGIPEGPTTVRSLTWRTTGVLGQPRFVLVLDRPRDTGDLA